MSGSTITLAWPSRALWANDRHHWSERARATKAARAEAFYACRSAGVPRGSSAVLRVAFHPPDRRRRDIQNMPHTLKAHIDGIADAVGCDDSNFEVHFPSRFGEVRRPAGAVVIEVEVAE